MLNYKKSESNIKGASRKRTETKKKLNLNKIAFNPKLAPTSMHCWDSLVMEHFYPVNPEFTP